MEHFAEKLNVKFLNTVRVITGQDHRDPQNLVRRLVPACLTVSPCQVDRPAVRPREHPADGLCLRRTHPVRTEVALSLVAAQVGEGHAQGARAQVRAQLQGDLQKTSGWMMECGRCNSEAPNLWVATQKWVSKPFRVGHRKTFSNGWLALSGGVRWHHEQIPEWIFASRVVGHLMVCGVLKWVTVHSKRGI